MSVTSITQSAKNAAPRASRVSFALNAFAAILYRDIMVTARNFIQFLIQVLLQPLFLLFVFGKILPDIGAARQGFASLLLPGVVALTILMNGIQGVTLPLVLDLGYSREIDDRLLAPLPVSLVAVEKVVFAALQALIAGAVIFPLAYWILGSGYQVRTDALGTLIGLMVLTAIASATLGLMIGTLVKPEQIGMMFSLIFTPLIFMGCVYYPWSTLDSLKWFQILTLFNPLTYASEGLRSAMVPPFQGHELPTLAIGWVLLALVGASVVFFVIGVRTFHKRVIS